MSMPHVARQCSSAITTNIIGTFISQCCWICVWMSFHPLLAESVIISFVSTRPEGSEMCWQDKEPADHFLFSSDLSSVAHICQILCWVLHLFFWCALKENISKQQTHKHKQGKKKHPFWCILSVHPSSSIPIMPFPSNTHTEVKLNYPGECIDCVFQGTKIRGGMTHVSFHVFGSKRSCGNLELWQIYLTASGGGGGGGGYL